MAENGLFPVSLERHQTRYWRRFTSFHFAEHMDACPIVIAEVPQIVTSFPIVFRLNRSGFGPVVLFSVTSGMASPFIDPDGRWLAPYVPSALRCFPFQAEFCTSGNTQSRLLVDEDSGFVTDDTRDDSFFTKDGVLTPDLCDVRRFLQTRHASAIKTAKICALIAEMELFEPLTGQEEITLPDGLLGIDTKRLERLPEAFKLSLFSSGALHLLHAHQLSLSHCTWLYRVQKQTISETKTQSNTFGGFVNAIAEDVLKNKSNAEVLHAMG